MNTRKLLACLIIIFGGIALFAGSACADNCDYQWERAKSAGDRYRRLKPDNSNSSDRIKATNKAFSAWKDASNACSGVDAARASDNAGIYLEANYYEYCRHMAVDAKARLVDAMARLDKVWASLSDDKNNKNATTYKSLYSVSIQAESDSRGVLTDISKVLSLSSSHAGKTYRCDADSQNRLKIIKEMAEVTILASQCAADACGNGE